MKHLLSIACGLLALSVCAQEKQKDTEKDSIVYVQKAKVLKPIIPKKVDTIGLTIKDYKIINFERDTTYLDTTLTIQKEYTYNYLPRDDFELMPFSNIGRADNGLGVNFELRRSHPRSLN
ncbi:MAG: putative porin [Maribacter sp.]